MATTPTQVQDEMKAAEARIQALSGQVADIRQRSRTVKKEGAARRDTKQIEELRKSLGL